MQECEWCASGESHPYVRYCQYCDEGKLHPSNFTLQSLPKMGGCRSDFDNVIAIADELQKVRSNGSLDDPVVAYYKGQAIHVWPCYSCLDAWHDYIGRSGVWGSLTDEAR